MQSMQIAYRTCYTKLRTATVLKRCVNLTLEVSHVPIVTIINVINEKILTLELLQENPKREFSLFLRDSDVRGFDCFGRENLVYAWIAGIIRESVFYDIAVEILSTMTLSLLIFICILQKMILHIRIFYLIWLQIRKLKRVNLTIWIKIVLLIL